MTRRSGRKRTTRRSGLPGWAWRGLLVIGVIVALAAAYLYATGQLDSYLQRAQEVLVEIEAAVQPTAAPLPRATAGVATPAPAAATSAPTDGSWYELYFSVPGSGAQADTSSRRIDQRFVALINSAKRTIDLAVYDFNLANVAEALAAAARRGVTVRMVTDTDTLEKEDEATQQALTIVRQANIPIVDDQRPALMHDKYLIADLAVVWTGSWNVSANDTFRNNNNAIRITSADLARNYTADFERMFVQKLFVTSKSTETRALVLVINGVPVENYFAPRDRVADRIAARLRQAKKSVQFMAFSFTSGELAEPLLAVAKDGVKVSGVFETTGSETQFSEFGPLKRAKLDVLQDGNPGNMHHKVFIIDDRTVIFGSFNFSNNADRDNNENLLIITDPALAKAFQQEFQRVYRQAKTR